jgi:chromate transporter
MTEQGTGKFRRRFLKDIWIASLGAYGGPESHLSVLMQQLVVKRRYFTETDLIEMAALANLLPGPTSTQIVISAGHKAGGPRLAFYAMLIWILPSILLLAALSFGVDALTGTGAGAGLFRFILPLSVGFIFLAALRIGRSAVADWFTAFLFLAGGVATYFIREPWIYPAVLLGGGFLAAIFYKEAGAWHRIEIRPPYRFLAAFLALAAVAAAIPLLTQDRVLNLFSDFFQYGYLVFGGGQIVVPMMYTQLVDTDQVMTAGEFLTGYGLVQGLPGPMFSFCAYAGGLAARDSGMLTQFAGALAAGIAVFLPGILLVYFAYPVWASLKSVRGIRIALRGVNSVAGGMIGAVGLLLLAKSGYTPENLVAAAATMGLLATGKIPPPLIVILALAAGLLLP